MQIKQSNLFKNSYKKIHKNQLLLVNNIIELIISNPNIGEVKTGDLSGVKVHKFNMDNHLYLLAYEYSVEDNLLYFMSLGEHEDFYAKLKKSLK